ncbi:aspartate dehydrogenase [Marinomonas epiphytica]
MTTSSPLKVAIIGLGAIGLKVAEAIDNQEAGKVTLVSLLCRNKIKYLDLLKNKDTEFKALITDDIQTLLAAQPDLVIEAAGQDSLAQYGETILSEGISLLVSSIGLFTDDKIFTKLVQCAEQAGTKILLSSGALPAIDWMSAAALSHVDDVSMTQTKPVASWRNTPAEQFIDLQALTEPTCFFQGNAREAANLFPKSSNISAMLALATIGLDSTKVRLVADPIEDKMHTDISFQGEVGILKTQWYGVPSETTPSTSADVPFAILKAVRNMACAIHYGA